MDREEEREETDEGIETMDYAGHEHVPTCRVRTYYVEQCDMGRRSNLQMGERTRGKLGPHSCLDLNFHCTVW